MQSQSLGQPGAAREPPPPPLCLPSSLANGFILRPTPSSFLRVDRVVRGRRREMPWCLYGKLKECREIRAVAGPTLARGVMGQGSEPVGEVEREEGR